MEENKIEEINYDELLITYFSKDGYLKVDKKMIKSLGILLAVFLSDLLSKRKYFLDKGMIKDGWFFNTQENRKKDTGLSSYQQTRILKGLVKKKIIETKLEGIPARQFFKIDSKVIILQILSIPEEEIEEHIEDPIPDNGKKDIRSKYQRNLDTDILETRTNNKNNSNKNNSNINKVTSSKEDVKVSKETKQPLPTNPPYKENTKDNPVIEGISLIRKKAKQATDRQRRQRKEQETEKNEVTVSEDEQDIINVWNSCGATKHGEGTKTYKEMVLSIRALIKGTFFNNISENWANIRFQKQDILGTIQNLSVAINSLDHEPFNKSYLKKLSFQTFLYNSYGDKHSKFLDYQNHPKELSETVREKEDKYPKVTKEFIRIWYKEELGMENIPDIKGVSKNKFISSSYKMREFYDKHKYDFAWGMDVFELCGLTYRALKESFGEGQITIGNLCSDYTYQNILPQYMERMAMWREK